MTIYIEEFLFQNILINFCLLRLVFLTCKPQSNTFKLVAASIVGAAFSVVAGVCLKNLVIINLFKIFSAVLMALIAFKQTKKQFVFNLILLFAFTHAFGGIITNFSSSAYITNFGVVISSKIKLETVCAVCVGLTYLFEMVFKHIKFKIKSGHFIYKTTLIKNNRKLTINAFLDTGNLLTLNGKPVIILDLKTYLKLNKVSLIDFYLKPSQQIALNSVAGTTNLKVFEIDKIIVNTGKKAKQIIAPLIAVNCDGCFEKTNYKALLSPAYL